MSAAVRLHGAVTGSTSEAVLSPFGGLNSMPPPTNSPIDSAKAHTAAM